MSIYDVIASSFFINFDFNVETLAEATLMAGLKNAFYHRINSLRRTEEPIITKKSPVGSIMMNERGEVKALGKGTVKAGPTKLLVWNKFDQSVRFLSSDNEKVRKFSEIGLTKI